MEVEIKLQPIEDEIILPLPYNQVIQGFIYNYLDKALSIWLHDEGYEFKKRKFKLFVFGRIVGTYVIEKSSIKFIGPIKFKIRSVNDEILACFAKNLLHQKEVMLNKNRCKIVSAEIKPDPIINFALPVKLKALSPITVYSTLLSYDGSKKKTYYYNPMEKDWERYVLENLYRKASALDLDVLEEETGKMFFKPIKVKQTDMCLLNFKGTIINGWMGIYQAFLPQPLFEIGYNGGFGVKNSQGFGLMEVISND